MEEETQVKERILLRWERGWRRGCLRVISYAIVGAALILAIRCKYAPYRVERRDFNGDGLEDIMVESKKSERTYFYGVASGDSVVYRTLEEIRELYHVEAERAVSKFSNKRH